MTNTRLRPNWQDYLLGLAFLVSQRSHDPSTQHGCVIVDEENRILGTGYNGYPKGMKDDTLPTTRPDKYPWMVHSEDNAIASCVLKPKNATAYVTGEPCFNCMRNLWQNGVTTIVYADRYGSVLIDEAERERKKKLISDTGLLVVKVEPNLTWVLKICEAIKEYDKVWQQIKD